MRGHGRRSLSFLGLDGARVVTEETAEHWAKEYLAGKSTYQIAEDWGVTHTTVRTHLKDLGIELRARGQQQITTEEIAEHWAKEYLAGKNTYQIAKEWGVTHTTVRVYLKDLGIELRARGAQQITTKEIAQHWASEYRAGKTTTEIAEEWGVSDVTVGRHLRNLGVKLRARGPRGER
jgi:DNA-binding CsgD family transcriptional regulator